jgi:hypothetical protein
MTLASRRLSLTAVATMLAIAILATLLLRAPSKGNAPREAKFELDEPAPSSTR